MVLQSHDEPARRTRVADDVDVVVCGAGPAGIAAALAAARSGASTRLLEVHGCLGGIWTAGCLSWIIDSGNKPGLMREITSELDRRDARASRGRNDYAYDVEEMKLLLEELCTTAGVKTQLHTRVVAAATDEARRLTTVVTESKSGRQAWRARAFIDCTGDGDLAALAGCGFDLGQPETGATQPLSLMAILTGLEATDLEIVPLLGGGAGEPKMRLLARMRDAGVEPSYAAPTLFRVYDHLFALMANHEYGVSALDAQGLSDATFRARAEVHRLVKALRGQAPGWGGVRIVATGAQIGVREGRRIHGRYTVTVDDLLAGRTHDDAVCRVTFGIDVHSTDPAATKDFDPANRTRTQPYDIPLRALIAKDVDGLLMAGRCISGDFLAHSSYRVTGNAVAMGEAAGETAARAAQANVAPHEVDSPPLR